MNDRAQLGALSESECNGSPLSPSEVAQEESYTTTRLRMQLEEEVRATENYVEFELGMVKVFLPALTKAQLKQIDGYAEALARRWLARRALEGAFPRG